MPTLGDALDACAGAWVNIEIKNDPRDPDFDPDDRVAVEVLADLAERGPGRWLISSLPAGDGRSLPAARSDGADGVADVDVDADTVDRAAAARPHRGAPVGAAVSRPTSIERCHDAGILVNALDVQRPAAAASAELASTASSRTSDVLLVAPTSPTVHARPAARGDGGRPTHPRSSGTGQRGHDEPDGVGDVVELEAVDLAEVVAVELVRERRRRAR